MIVCAAAEESSISTSLSCRLAAPVVIVTVRVAAELLVTVLTMAVIGTVAALADAVIALFDTITEPEFTEVEKVCAPVNVFAASVRAIVADVEGKVRVVPSVPLRVRELLKNPNFPCADCALSLSQYQFPEVVGVATRAVYVASTPEACT